MNQFQGIIKNLHFGPFWDCFTQIFPQNGFRQLLPLTDLQLHLDNHKKLMTRISDKIEELYFQAVLGYFSPCAFESLWT